MLRKLSALSLLALAQEDYTLDPSTHVTARHFTMAALKALTTAGIHIRR